MQPAVIAPGHAESFAVTPDMAREFTARVEKQDEFFKELIADPDTDLGLDPDWLQTRRLRRAGGRPDGGSGEEPS
jgi:hypothetical protein